MAQLLGYDASGCCYGSNKLQHQTASPPGPVSMLGNAPQAVMHYLYMRYMRYMHYMRFLHGDSLCFTCIAGLLNWSCNRWSRYDENSECSLLR